MTLALRNVHYFDGYGVVHVLKLGKRKQEKEMVVMHCIDRYYTSVLEIT